MGIPPFDAAQEQDAPPKKRNNQATEATRGGRRPLRLLSFLLNKCLISLILKNK